MPPDLPLDLQSLKHEISIGQLWCDGDEEEFSQCKHSNRPKSESFCNNDEIVGIYCFRHQPRGASFDQSLPQIHSKASQNSDVTQCGRNEYLDVMKSSGIVGGVDALPNEFPWLVKVEVPNGIFRCGGSIVAPGYILTSAHCFYKGDHSATVVTSNGKHRTKASKIIIHPNYNYPINDLAILVLDESLEIQPICIPTLCDDCNGDFNYGIIAGWGLLSTGSQGSDKLQRAFVNLVSKSECQREWEHVVDDDSLICAGWDAGGVGICSGDSGGPLMTIVDGRHTICGVAR